MGKIEVICGPMFSGKSEELMRRLNRALIAKRPFQLYKPAADSRYSKDEVVSHAGKKMKCTPIQDAGIMVELVEKETKIVAIDEAQFFGPGLLPTILSLVGAGKRVMVAGLDMDSDGVPFGSMGSVMAMAESITKLRAVCEVCGEDATHTYRRKDCDTSQILVGEKDFYEARCRAHWIP